MHLEQSTETARVFYLTNGYVIDGRPDHKHGAGGYPMSKSLPPVVVPRSINQ